MRPGPFGRPRTRTSGVQGDADRDTDDLKPPLRAAFSPSTSASHSEADHFFAASVIPEIISKPPSGPNSQPCRAKSPSPATGDRESPACRFAELPIPPQGPSGHITDSSHFLAFASVENILAIAWTGREMRSDLPGPPLPVVPGAMSASRTYRFIIAPSTHWPSSRQPRIRGLSACNGFPRNQFLDSANRIVPMNPSVKQNCLRDLTLAPSCGLSHNEAGS